MIPKYFIEIDAKDFIRGMSVSKHIANGGFSPETTAVNLIASPGALYSPMVGVDASTNLAGNIIASAGDANVSGVDKYFLTDTGKFFTLSGSTLTLRQTDGTGSYVVGSSDFVQFQLQAFATTATNVVLLTGSLLATIDATWWTVTKGKSALQSGQRHPLLVYEKKLWIGDKSNLHSWDGTTASENVLALSSEQSIVSLGIESGTGYMLIGITEGQNYSNLIAQVAKILVWDGFSAKPLRSVVVEDAVNAFYSVGGTTFITYGTKLGYWNGSGISYLRTFQNITRSGSVLAYKHKITNIGQTLYIADSSRVLAYGEVLPGQKVFYPAYLNSSAIGTIADIGNGTLGIGYSTAKLITFNTEGTSTIGSENFYTNKFNFPRPVIIRSCFVEYASTVSSGATPIRVWLIDEKQVSTEFSSFLNSKATGEFFRESKNLDIKVRTGQFLVLLSNVNPGIRRIVIGYDTAE